MLENGGLLLAGILSGAVSALIAVIPQLAAVETHINWSSLAVLLAGIMCVGFGACLLAGNAAVRDDLIGALREE